MSRHGRPIRQRPRIKTDLDACQDQAATKVNETNAKTGLAWFASPVRRWSQIGGATRACMAAKGYGEVRWCTADELRRGSRQGDVIVTASGVQCVDPPSADRRRPAAR